MISRFFTLLFVLCTTIASTTVGCGGSQTQEDEFGDPGSDTSMSAPSFGDYETITVTDDGTISGRVRLAGEAPKLDGFDITSDKDVCAPAANNNRLEVGADGGVRYAVVYIENITRGKAMPTGIEQSVVMDQQNCQYTPHVVAAPVGSVVTFLNSDQVAHNVRVEDDSTDRIVLNRAQPTAGARDTMHVVKAGPYRVGCDYHPWMNAYIFGVTNPYYAVTDAEGRFSIDGIPPGEHTVKMWFNGIETIPRRDNQGKLVRYAFSEHFTRQQQVTVQAGTTSTLDFELTVQQ